jgi:hypothetical protein
VLVPVDVGLEVALVVGVVLGLVVALEVCDDVGDVVADVVGVVMSHSEKIPSTYERMAVLNHATAVEQVMSSTNKPALHSTCTVTSAVGSANILINELTLEAASAQLLLASEVR